MSNEVARAIVLRQFAALRRHGLSAAEALARTLEGLPAGKVRDACVLASRSLLNPELVGPDDLVRVLANPTGEPVHAESLAEAIDARLDARDSLRAITALAQFMVAGPLLLITLVGWFAPTNALGVSEVTLPGPTQVLLGLAAFLKWPGVPLTILAVLGLSRLPLSFAPGLASFARAQRVLEASTWAQPAAQLGQLDLPALERQWLFASQAHTDLGTALRTLAGELTREGRASVASFRVYAPAAAGLFALSFFSGVLIALYLPIFSIAGAIK